MIIVFILLYICACIERKDNYLRSEGTHIIEARNGNDKMMVARCPDATSDFMPKGMPNPYRNPALRIPDSVKIHFLVEMLSRQPLESHIWIYPDSSFVQCNNRESPGKRIPIPNNVSDSLTDEIRRLFITHQDSIVDSAKDIKTTPAFQTPEVITVRVYLYKGLYQETKIIPYIYANCYEISYTPAFQRFWKRLFELYFWANKY